MLCYSAFLQTEIYYFRLSYSKPGIPNVLTIERLLQLITSDVTAALNPELTTFQPINQSSPKATSLPTMSTITRYSSSNVYNKQLLFLQSQQCYFFVNSRMLHFCYPKNAKFFSQKLFFCNHHNATYLYFKRCYIIVF